jgi:hypothetical protein
VSASTTLFVRSMEEWREKVGDGLEALARVAIQDMAEDVIDHTNLDTGFLVGNWQPSIGVPATATVDRKGTAAAGVSLHMALSDLNPGETFFYVNNAVYAKRIEFGFVGEDSLGRLYNQQGSYMVTNAIARWPTHVAKAVIKLGLQK